MWEGKRGLPRRGVSDEAERGGGKGVVAEGSCLGDIQADRGWE